jgi:FKBP-type peptidyl-prolyl cis-trans isomerase 2
VAKYQILYKLCHANGALVDESWQEPLNFELGDGQLAPCLESCVLEAKPLVLQTFLLSSEEAFGCRSSEAIQTLNRKEFPANMQLEPNTAISFTTPTGEEFVGVVQSASLNQVVVDFNHPLADCDVSFQVKRLN